VAIAIACLWSAQSRGSSLADAGYVDSKVCATCHSAIAATYSRTGMGRSFYRPQPANRIEDYTSKNTYYHKPSDSYFTMTERDGHYFQRRYQTGIDGKQINVEEKEADFVIGSGNHSRTYLHRTGRNTLVELPLAWYAEKGGYWAMNPGYDRPDHQDFRRTIGIDCLFCHNAYPDIPEANQNSNGDSIFPGALPEGIDCQRCHGPGQKHARLAADSRARREDIRAAIVNPAKLPAERQMEVCMQCHLETTSFPLPNSIVRYDRKPFSYRPGEPLADFILYFDHAPGKGRDDKFEIASSAYRLRQSQCFLKSNGGMSCTTCHDPHNVPRGEQAAQHYTAVCRQCHGAALDRLVASAKHPRSADCTGCHMPKRRTEDVVHVVMTDHKIQRRPPAGNALAEIPERHETSETPYRGNVELYYPHSLPKPEDELYLATAQVLVSSNLSDGIQRLSAAIEKYHPERPEFYLNLGDALRNDGKLEQARAQYAEALLRKPDALPELQKLALCLSSLRQYARATDVLKRAVELVPNDATTWVQLGLSYVDQGRKDDAVAAFQKAIALDPELPEAYNSLGGVWFETRDAARAEPMLREAVRLTPNYAEAQNNLGSLLSAAGHFDEARYHYEAALRIKPDYAFARFDYAIALARAGHLEEGQAQAEAVLSATPNYAEAHEFLGTLLMTRGQAQAAIAHYREAVRIRPDFSRANLNLGSALADSGDAAGARPYLEKVAQSADPAIRQEAQRILQRLNSAR
jgi:FimV-like protein